MSILLKSGMSLDLVTGQIYLSQNLTDSTGDASENTEEANTTDVAGAEGEVSGEAGEEAPSEETNTEGEEESADSGQEAGMDESMAMDGAGMTGMEGMEGMEGMYPGMDGDMGAQTAKDPILSNWFFVGGVSAGTFIVSIILGLLLAKRRIKKGIELYED